MIRPPGPAAAPLLSHEWLELAHAHQNNPKDSKEAIVDLLFHDHDKAVYPDPHQHVTDGDSVTPGGLTAAAYVNCLKASLLLRACY